MKLFIKKILIYLFVIISLIMIINLISDPSNLFSNTIEEKIATYISSRQNVTYATNVNERVLQKLIIEKLTFTPETVVLGSSRVMLVGNDHIKKNTFFNSSVSGASLEDIIAIHNIYLRNNKAPSNLVIGIDPWMLNDNSGQDRWRSIKYYYDSYKTEETNFSSLSSTLYNYKQLISLSYFQSSVLNILKKRFNIFEAPQVDSTEKWVNDTFTKRSDGTICYDRDYRDVTSEEIDQKARNYLSSEIYGLEKFYNISEDLVEELQIFFAYLQKQNIDVSIILMPYHPIVYDYLMVHYPIVKKVEEYLNEFTISIGTKLKGSYNPYNYSLTTDDFYDGMHLNEQGISKVLQQGDTIIF